MAHPSFAPVAHVYADDEIATRVTVRPRSAHLSLVPSANAGASALEPVGETFRKLGSMPPAPCDNDELTEDELFAIWVAHLC
ncbi:hypothetical protein BH11MYX4_BH11MYX4_47750 [soil metagenome]